MLYRTHVSETCCKLTRRFAWYFVVVVMLNQATRVIFYLAHLLFYIILHIINCDIINYEYISALRLIVLPCILLLLAKFPLKFIYVGSYI